MERNDKQDKRDVADIYLHVGRVQTGSDVTEPVHLENLSDDVIRQVQDVLHGVNQSIREGYDLVDHKTIPHTIRQPLTDGSIEAIEATVQDRAMQKKLPVIVISLED